MCMKLRSSQQWWALISPFRKNIRLLISLLLLLFVHSDCKEAIPPLAIPGHGCAPSGIPRAVTSVTVVTLVLLSLYSHYIGIRTIYIGPVYSHVISLITPHHHSLTWLCQSILKYWNKERATGPKPTPEEHNATWCTRSQNRLTQNCDYMPYKCYGIHSNKVLDKYSYYNP